jgi:hypothetical protein
MVVTPTENISAAHSSTKDSAEETATAEQYADYVCNANAVLYQCARLLLL